MKGTGTLTTRRVDASGRQIKPPTLQLVQTKRNTRGIHLDQTKDGVYYRWLHGQKERYIAKKLGIQREEVEEIIREKVSGKKAA